MGRGAATGAGRRWSVDREKMKSRPPFCGERGRAGLEGVRERVCVHTLSRPGVCAGIGGATGVREGRRSSKLLFESRGSPAPLFRAPSATTRRRTRARLSLRYSASLSFAHPPMVLSDLVSRLVNLVMGRLAEALEVRERGRGQGARVGPPSFAPRPPILFFSLAFTPLSILQAAPPGALRVTGLLGLVVVIYLACSWGERAARERREREGEATTKKHALTPTLSLPLLQATAAPSRPTGPPRPAATPSSRDGIESGSSPR